MNNFDIASCINTLGTYNTDPINDRNGNPIKNPLSLPNGLQGVMADAVSKNAQLLGLLQIWRTTDKEVPTLYTLFDVTVKMMECLNLSEFISKFSTKMSKDEQYEQSLIASTFIKEKGLDNILGKNVLNILRDYRDLFHLVGFFNNLMRMASSMARITGQPNAYNDYRIKHNIQAELACFDCELECNNCNNCKCGYLYDYTTGETIEMQKTYGEYKEDIYLYREDWLNAAEYVKLPF